MKKSINDMIKEGRVHIPIGRFGRDDEELIKEREKIASCSTIEFVALKDLKKNTPVVLGLDVELRDNMQNNKKGLKYNEGKPMLAQFYKHFPNAYKAMVDNATYGFEKYKEDIGDPNWKKNTIEEYEDALFRHFDKYLTGETIDLESGKKHLAAIIWNSCVLYELNEIKENK